MHRSSTQNSYCACMWPCSNDIAACLKRGWPGSLLYPTIFKEISFLQVQGIFDETKQFSMAASFPTAAPGLEHQLPDLSFANNALLHLLNDQAAPQPPSTHAAPEPDLGRHLFQSPESMRPSVQDGTKTRWQVPQPVFDDEVDEVNVTAFETAFRPTADKLQGQNVHTGSFPRAPEEQYEFLGDLEMEDFANSVSHPACNCIISFCLLWHATALHSSCLYKLVYAAVHVLVTSSWMNCTDLCQCTCQAVFVPTQGGMRNRNTHDLSQLVLTLKHGQQHVIL